MSLFLIILAAGNSKRLNSRTPKPFQLVNNKTLLEYSLDSFNGISEIKKKILVYNRKHKKNLKKIKLPNVTKIIGGNNRQESTFIALKKIKKMNCTKVLIHDAARPNLSKKLIKKIIFHTKKNDAVIPVIKGNDATKRISKNIIFKNINKNNLRFAQTPQGFSFKKIYNKHAKNINSNIDDDATLFTNENEKVFIIKGSKENFKVTDKEDLNILRSLKKGKTYYGIGFDVHRLIKKRNLYLGGIKIPFHLGLKGHSDADPVLHAIIDSLLGACRLGNIGSFFSNKNKKYKNIRSTELLRKTVSIINLKGFYINNIDINIITEKPNIKKYEKKMKNVISKICQINYNQISVKGRTSEKLGLVGKLKAIASEAISSVKKYD